MNEDLNEVEALAALVTSDGWALFLKAVDASHGDTASTRQVDAALKNVTRGDIDGAHDTVLQIRSRALAVQAMVRWPEERLKLLKGKKEKGMFTALRRA